MNSNERNEYMKKVTIGEKQPLYAGIILNEHDSNWHILFEREAINIRKVLGNKVLMLEHVGSTAVPNLCAKPIIDMLLVVSDSSDESSYVPDMEAAGYKLLIREPDWFEHRMFKGVATDINLHVFSEGASEIQKMLLFRNHLRIHDADRELYAQAKHKLAQRTWKYVQDYADAKSNVIQDIIKLTIPYIK